MDVFKKLIISLVILVLLSLFFLIFTYTAKLNSAEITSQELSILEYLHVFTATDTDERLAQLHAVGNKNAWMHLAQLHAHKSPNTAFQLGEYFLNRNNKRSAVIWFKTAIRQKHSGARLALANIYFESQQYLAIKPLLLPIITNDKALTILYKLALHQGDLNFVDKYKSQLAKANDADFYRELVHYSVFNDTLEEKKIGTQSSSSVATCLFEVQLFATNLAGLRHAVALISSFEQHRLSEYICLAPPKYIPSKTINCQNEISKHINCNARVWLTRKDVSSRYIGLIVEQGAANVDNGIMYLDQHDTIDVLVHELSHFIGFLDEYPLSKQHQVCQKAQETPFAHNLVILDKNYQGNRKALREHILSQVPWRDLIKDSTPILSQGKNGWQLATPREFNDQVGVFKADTCFYSSHVQAFKPITRRTKLEYFELTFPEIYERIFLLAPRQYLMPSYHYNISQDLVEQGELSEAIEVLQTTLFD